jgi:polar amino acid transport system substrate-binding protein
MFILVTCQGETYKAGVGPTNIPFIFLKNDEKVGFDLDILKALAQVGDFQYEIVQGSTFVDLFDKIKNKEVNFGFAIAITDERKKTYDFSVPYFVSAQNILTKEENGISNAQDLIGKKVAVIKGTTGEAAMQKLFGADSPNLKSFDTNDEAIPALENGEVDVFLRGKGTTLYYAKEHPGYVSVQDDSAFEPELLAVMFSKGSELVAEISSAITGVLENGDYAKIYNDWYGISPDVDILLEAGKLEDPYSVYN